LPVRLVTNTLDYYTSALITAVKSFILHALDEEEGEEEED